MKQKDLVFLVVSAFLIVFSWITFNIYHNYTTSTIPETLGVEIAPINPNFDTQTIERLKNRKKIDPLFEIPQSALIQEPSPSIASPSPLPVQVTVSPTPNLNSPTLSPTQSIQKITSTP